MLLKELDSYFRDFLRIGDLSDLDYSLNGLQIERQKKEIEKAAFAVDACMETFRRAANQGADILVVHHGLFWGKDMAITGSHYERIRFCMDHDLALYAVHLPLDMHPEYGNNAAYIQMLGIKTPKPFGDYKGVKIGYQGTLPKALTIDEILTRIGLEKSDCLSILPFGPDKISSLGIITGSAAKDVEQALAEDLDLFITGEITHQIYHQCLEEGINLIAGGHYQTEVWGVKNLARKAAEEIGIETFFIDVPTGL